MSLDINGSNMSERQLVTFHLGNDEFGADIMNVKEIVRVSEITKVPNAPAYIEGVCNLRGNVLPIVDGRVRLNMSKKENDENSRVLVIDTGGKTTGMVVDRVSEVMRVSEADIEPPPSIIRSIESEHLNGVVKLNNGSRLIMLLQMDKILDSDEAEIIRNEANERIKAAAQETREKETVDEEQMVSFVLGNEEYGINIMHVKEIIRVPEVVQVPNSEAYIDGVVSIRNNLLPIINMRKYFGLEVKEITDHTRILVVDMGTVTSGIMVDRISEVIRVPANLIQPPPAVFCGSEGSQFKGVAKLDNGKRLILLLEPSKLLLVEDLKNMETSQSGVSEAKSIEKQLLDEEQLVTFKIDREEYGIRITDVQEINRMTDITKIPRAPRFIEGIVNLRGNIIPAMDLRKRFGLDEKVRSDSTRVIIVDLEGKKTGIIVDSVSEVLRFEKSLIDNPPQILSNGIEEKYIEGVGKLNDGKRMILIINLREILLYICAEASKNSKRKSR